MADRHRHTPACWMVALPAVDGKEYVYRVYAPPDALPGDLFWTAFHCHDDSLLPRAYDCFDCAEIWRTARGDGRADGPERTGGMDHADDSGRTDAPDPADGRAGVAGSGAEDRGADDPD